MYFSVFTATTENNNKGKTVIKNNNKNKLVATTTKQP